jgi:ubiquinone biosynthesis protein UbiJ
MEDELKQLQDKVAELTASHARISQQVNDNVQRTANDIAQLRAQVASLDTRVAKTEQKR